MKNIKHILLISILFSTFSCSDIVDDINQDLTELSPDVIPPEKLLTGAQLSNTLAQVGHASKISAMYSGQLIGYAAQYRNIYEYALTSEETTTTWSRIYQGVVPQVRLIISKLEDRNLLLQGICRVMEAHAVGTAASIFGDVPYAEIFDEEISDPDFDEQVVVFAALQILLDTAIENLNEAGDAVIAEDIYYAGDRQKWLEAAWTLKARYYMHTKSYALAYAAAQNGISDAEGTMYFTPIGDPGEVGSKNTIFTPLNGSRAGDFGTGTSHLMTLIDPAGAGRNNAKTDETARFEYYEIKESSGVDNLGVGQEFEPQKLITLEENLLILAESGARTEDFDTGLGHLNELRQHLNTGIFLNANFNTRPFTYNDYVTVDFQIGGLENADGIDPTRALLREIIEERYVSGFLTYMPFDDARRLRKTDSDIAVAIPLNTGTATAHPERLVYPDNEINTNLRIPNPLPELVAATQVNQ